MFRWYHWTPELVDSYGAMQVLRNVRLIRQQEAEEKIWQLQIAAAPQAGGEYFESVAKRIQRLGEVGRRRRDAFEVVSDQQRVRMLGTLLGKKEVSLKEWSRTGNLRWLDWLRNQNVTQSQAVQVAEEWRKKELSDPFWEE